MDLLIALRATLVTLVVTGVAYPFVVTGLAQVLFPARANGSLVQDDRGSTVGSELLAQRFTAAAYFQPRPSAAGDNGYDGLSSGGSNLGVTSAKLKDRIAADVQRLRAENPDAPGDIPDELVTASGSGLDPHLSSAAIAWQTPRVAKARGVARERIDNLAATLQEGRDLGFLGEPRTNVLDLNLALDRQFGRPVPALGGDTRRSAPAP
jgi:K+-transporting ATPase ATPase C chain